MFALENFQFYGTYMCGNALMLYTAYLLMYCLGACYDITINCVNANDRMELVNMDT